MDTKEVLIHIAVGFCCLLSVSAPAIIRAFPTNYPESVLKSARRYTFLSALVVAVALLRVSGVSFVGDAANALVVGVALGCGMFLAFFSCNLRPILVGVPLGAVSLLAWPLVAAYLLVFTTSFQSWQPIVKSQDGLYCKVSKYGSQWQRRGEEFELLRRFWFVQHSVLVHRVPYHRDLAPVPAYAGQERVEQCKRDLGRAEYQQKYRPSSASGG